MLKLINIFIPVIGTLSVQIITIMLRAHHIIYTFKNDNKKLDHK